MVGLAKKLITAIAARNYYRSITTEALTTYLTFDVNPTSILTFYKKHIVIS